MADPTTILNSNGPLPLTASVESPGVGTATLFVSGSAFTGEVPSLLKVDVLVNDDIVGSAKVFANVKGPHQALIPSLFIIELPPFEGGEPPMLKITLQYGNKTTRADQNDYFQVVLLK